MDNSVLISFPVTCPVCGSESLATFPITSVATAVDRNTPIWLSARCHDQKWNATDLERTQIRQYLIAIILDPDFESERHYHFAENDSVPY